MRTIELVTGAALAVAISGAASAACALQYLTIGKFSVKVGYDVTGCKSLRPAAAGRALALVCVNTHGSKHVCEGTNAQRSEKTQASGEAFVYNLAPGNKYVVKGKYARSKHVGWNWEDFGRTEFETTR